MALPGGAIADYTLPVLPVPNAIRQKAIFGKTQGGHVQHEATSEEMLGPFSPMGKPQRCCPVSPARLGWKISLLLSLQGHFFGMLSSCGCHSVPVGTGRDSGTTLVPCSCGARLQRVRRAGPWALPHPAGVVIHLLEIRCFPESPNPHTGVYGTTTKVQTLSCKGCSVTSPLALGEAVGEL